MHANGMVVSYKIYHGIPKKKQILFSIFFLLKKLNLIYIYIYYIKIWEETKDKI